MIRIEHLKKEYPNVTPLKDVSFEIHDGDVISVIGPSGTGKSTLLRCINQLEKPTSGDDLAVSLIRGMTETVDYSWDETQDLKNVLHLMIRHG
ncbi:MAG: ATP-binding cassette domain-containing protein [Lachnospiraceae bacterium]|nr:ATP-binding cassette domain-containing protein [Lachnospiraceae bacterium]